jgi:DNA-binding response OmpR family regulator
LSQDQGESIRTNRVGICTVNDRKSQRYGGVIPVSIKSSPVFAAAHETSIREFTATLSQVERILPFSNERSADSRITELELDSLQVALVPFQNTEASAEASFALKRDLSRLVLLPLTWKQLIVQVHKSVNRSGELGQTNLVHFGEVRIDLMAMEVHRRNHPVILTAMEFKVLKFFILNPNQVISRDDMLDRVWGYENYPCTRTVDNHILRLRQKLEVECANPVHFRTVYGVGYKFVP